MNALEPGMHAPTEPGYKVDLSRRHVLFGGAMIGAAALGVALVPRPAPPLLRLGQLEKIVPRQFGEWRYASSSGLILPPDEGPEGTAVYDQVLTRVYTAPGSPAMMLLIAFGGGQSGLVEIHRPEYCYPSQGYKLSDRVAAPLSFGGARQAPAVIWTARNDQVTEQLLYWTRVGDRFPVTWLESKVAVVMANLNRKLPDGVLVRVSTISNDTAESHAAMIRFAKALVASLGPLGSRVLLGPIS